MWDENIRTFYQYNKEFKVANCYFADLKTGHGGFKSVTMRFFNI